MRSSGSVKFYDDKRGFGFLKPEEGGSDVFFHVRELQKAGIDKVVEGDKFLFEIEDAGDGRKRATALQKATQDRR